MKNIKIILLLVLSIIICGCGNKEIENSKELKITFDSNPSTGYHWESETYNEGVIKITESYESDCKDENIVGCGGKTIFTITPLMEGTEIIDFSYIAPNGEDEEYNATYYITVGENLNIKEDTHNGTYFNKSK